MSKDHTRIFFYGFVVGTVLLLIPVPQFVLWNGILEHVETMLRFIGFIFFAICGIAILERVVRTLMGK